MTKEPANSRLKALIPPRLSNFPACRSGMARSASPACAVAAARRTIPADQANVFKEFIRFTPGLRGPRDVLIPPQKITILSVKFACENSKETSANWQAWRGGIPRFATGLVRRSQIG